MQIPCLRHCDVGPRGQTPGHAFCSPVWLSRRTQLPDSSSSHQTRRLDRVVTRDRDPHRLCGFPPGFYKRIRAPLSHPQELRRCHGRLELAQEGFRVAIRGPRLCRRSNLGTGSGWSTRSGETGPLIALVRGRSDSPHLLVVTRNSSWYHASSWVEFPTAP